MSDMYEILNKNYDGVRFVYNWALEEKILSYNKNKKLWAYQLFPLLRNLKTKNQKLHNLEMDVLEKILMFLDDIFEENTQLEKDFPPYMGHQNRKQFIKQLQKYIA